MVTTANNPSKNHNYYVHENYGNPITLFQLMVRFVKNQSIARYKAMRG